jgi:Uri superfamily endonuclease
MSKGFYQLVLYLNKKSKIKIGKKGEYLFPKGYYIYTGSAQNYLEARVKRHLRKDKSKFWHIDYLLPYCKILKVIANNEKQKEVETECRLNQSLLELKDARIVMKGFGSSDCRCPSHLVYFKKANPITLLYK